MFLREAFKKKNSRFWDITYEFKPPLAYRSWRHTKPICLDSKGFILSKGELSLRVGETVWLVKSSFFSLISAYLVWREQMGASKDK